MLQTEYHTEFKRLNSTEGSISVLPETINILHTGCCRCPHHNHQKHHVLGMFFFFLRCFRAVVAVLIDTVII